MKTSKIRVKVNGADINAHPIYPDNFHIERERAEGEMFMRTKLNLSLTFVRQDFDVIYGSSLDSTFEVSVYDIPSGILLASGTFEKTDCKFNIDDRTCTVTVSSADDYDKILNGLDNEYDLVGLAPVRERIKLSKRAILQVYFSGDNKITNIIGNMSYEVDTAREVDDGTELRNMGFELLYKYATFTFDFDTAHLPYPDALGNYRAEYVDGTTSFVNENGYYFHYVVDSVFSMQQRLYDPNGNVVPNFFVEGRQGVVSQAYLSNVEIVWRPDASQSGIKYGDGILNRAFAYGRVLVDRNDFPTPLSEYYQLDSNDISTNNLNYHYAMRATIGGLKNLFVNSFEVQDEPTKYGVNGDGKYFVQPSPMYVGVNVIPIGWNKWIPLSFWLQSTPALADTLDVYDTELDFNDAYPLWSAIKVLLAKIDPSLSFDGTSAYSQFLYGTIGADEILGWVQNLPYITPITNIKRTYYNQAARKGNITLRQILDMLRATCQLYWFIDNQKRLRIEHISWFKNGGAYSQSRPIIDLSQITSRMLGKKWSYDASAYSYAKSDLIKRYEFSWGDKVSEVFDGFPIDIRNRFVGMGKTERAVASNFISDIDLITSAPDVLGDDSFALIGTNASKRCPIQSIGNFGMDFVAPIYKMQNPYFSFYYSELAYWIYNLGGNDARTTQYKTASGGDGVIRVIDTQRVKTQSVTVPMPTSKVSATGLIRTPVGVGELVKTQYTPEDGMMKIEIILPTED